MDGVYRRRRYTSWGAGIAGALVFASILGVITRTFPAPVEKYKKGTLYYFVDPQRGSDSNKGTKISAPFKSIARAKGAVKAVSSRMKSDIVVFLRGGTYTLDQSVVFNESDSGMNGHQVIYQNWADEEVIISGGKKIKGWTLHDSVKNIYKARVGSTDRFREIYVNGKRGIRSRLPNRTDENTRGKFFQGANLVSDKTPYQYTVPAREVSAWAKEGQVELVMVHHWQHRRARIATYKVGNGLATLNFQPLESDMFLMKHWNQANAPHYFENSYSFIDAPGEWFLDVKTNTLFYKPRRGENMSSAEVIVPKVEVLFSLRGSNTNKLQNIVLRGLTFQHSVWTKPDEYGFLNGQAATEIVTRPDGLNTEVPGALEFQRASSIMIDKCKVRHTGAHAVLVRDNVSNITIQNSLFSNTSAGGIYMHLENAASVNKRLINNIVEHYGLEYTGAVGILVGVMPNVAIQNNEIRFGRYSGISIGWNWSNEDTIAKNVDIGYNLIHNVQLLHGDGGGIYTLGKIPGMRIHNNYIRQSAKSPYAGDFAFASIYLDNGSSMKTVDRNVIENCVEAFYALNQPNHDNVIRQNFHNCPLGRIHNQNKVADNRLVRRTLWYPDCKGDYAFRWSTTIKDWRKQYCQVDLEYPSQEVLFFQENGSLWAYVPTLKFI